MNSFWQTHPTAKRAVTATVLTIILLSCLFATHNIIPIALFLLTAVTLGAGEWLQLMPKVNAPKLFIMLPPVVAIILYSFPIFPWGSEPVSVVWLALWVASSVFWLVALNWVKQYPSHVEWHNKNLYMVGILLLTAMAIALIAMWQVSPWWLVYLIGIISSADIGAYFSGRAFGKRKLAPNVSPAKSVEGFLGGIVLTAIVTLSVALGLLHLSGMSLVCFVLLSFFTGLISVLGDLFESMLKRQAGIKDSGKLLPGHGGVLDRLDSIMAAAPLFALGFFLHGGF